MCPQQRLEARNAHEGTPCHKLNSAIAVISIDIGKNSFHIVGHDKRAAIMLRQKWSHTARQPAGEHRPAQVGGYHQGWMGLRAGSSGAYCLERCSGR
jgi:hypothetical protein